MGVKNEVAANTKKAWKWTSKGQNNQTIVAAVRWKVGGEALEV